MKSSLEGVLSLAPPLQGLPLKGSISLCFLSLFLAPPFLTALYTSSTRQGSNYAAYAFKKGYRAPPSFSTFFSPPPRIANNSFLPSHPPNRVHLGQQVMAAPPISPNRQHSHLQDLPISSPNLNRTNSARSSLGYDDPRMATLASATHLTLPFPRQTSSEFFRNTTPSPATSPLSNSSSPPTWPNPSSYTFSPTSKKQDTPTSTSSYSTLKKTGLAPGKLICFELALGDRLAARLDGETTLQSIKEASGVISTEITEDEGPKRLISTGSASAVQKARQLVDAKLSQTPIRTLVGIKLPPSTSSLSFTPTIGPHVSRFQPVSASTYRLVASSSPPTNHSPSSQSFAPRPDLLSYPSTTSVISDFSLPPSHHQSSATSPAPLTPSSEKSNDSFFTVRENSPTPSPPCPTRGLAMTLASPPTSTRAAGLEDERIPPQIGNFEERRDGYIEAMVDELEGAVKRRSLVRVKLDIGSQEWRREGKNGGEREFEEERWSLEEVEKWKTDSLSLSTTSPSSPVSPLFATSLSHSTSLQLLSTLISSSKPHSSFSKKAEISQVHILHLDKSRASFGCAIADCRGQELRNLPSKGTPASGTLVLKKCSTLPSKPFALSIVSPPTSEGSTIGQQRDGCDLRLKILADKAATSPSLDLSAAMQSATWELDDFGEFRVSVNLKEERFGKGETEIRWISRERWENSDGSLRFTLSEQRYSESSKHDRSVELCSPALNKLLADYALDQAQGKKGRWEREKVRSWVEKLVEFGQGLVEQEEVDELSEKIVSGLVLGSSD